MTVLMSSNMLIGNEQALDKSKAETGREIQLPLPRCPQRYSKMSKEGHVITSNDFIENAAKQKLISFFCFAQEWITEGKNREGQRHKGAMQPT